jgi:hypothetical protein
MPNGNHNYGNFNQGVNYMNPGQQQMPGQPMPGQPMPGQPMPGQQPVMPQQPTPVAPVGAPAGGNAMLDKLKNNKTMMVGVIAGAVVLLLVIVFFGSKLLNPSYSVVNKYMSGMKSMNAEKIAKLYDEAMIEAMYDGDEDEIIDSLEELFEEQEDKDYKITSFKIRDCETYSEDELDDLADDLEDYYDIDGDDVKAAKKYWVKISVDKDGEKDIEYTDVTVIKIKNKWSLYS